MSKRKAAYKGRGKVIERPTGPSRHDKGASATQSNPSGLIWIYGKHAVQAVLENPERKIHRFMITKNAEQDMDIPPGVGLNIVNPKDIEALVPRDAVHQGCAVEVSPLEQYDLSDLTPDEDVPFPLVLVLDQVTDPHNVGAIARSAAAFGVNAIIVPDRKAAPESGVMAKTACGGIEVVPILRTVNLVQTLETLKEMGYWSLGFAGEAPQSLEEAVQVLRDTPTAIVMGAEGSGLRRLTREHCDHLARIPMSPYMESLNVSNATAIALYAFKHAEMEAMSEFEFEE